MNTTPAGQTVPDPDDREFPDGPAARRAVADQLVAAWRARYAGQLPTVMPVQPVTPGRLTWITPAEVRQVLRGLVAGPGTPDALKAAGVMADAATGEVRGGTMPPVPTSRPTTPVLAALAEILMVPHDATDEQIIDAARATVDAGTTARAQREEFRDMLTALLELGPWAPDGVIVEAATARLAQDAARRSAAKTADMLAKVATTSTCDTEGCDRVVRLGAAHGRCCVPCVDGATGVTGATPGAHSDTCDARQQIHGRLTLGPDRDPVAPLVEDEPQAVDSVDAAPRRRTT